MLSEMSDPHERDVGFFQRFRTTAKKMMSRDRNAIAPILRTEYDSGEVAGKIFRIIGV